MESAPHPYSPDGATKQRDGCSDLLSSMRTDGKGHHWLHHLFFIRGFNQRRRAEDNRWLPFIRKPNVRVRVLKKKKQRGLEWVGPGKGWGLKSERKRNISLC